MLAPRMIRGPLGYPLRLTISEEIPKIHAD